MFCPKCTAYLTEKDLIKTDVKYAPGNVPIEYDAICPQCRVDMGRVSWGQLKVDPELQKKLDAEAAKTARASAPAEVAAPQTQDHGKSCPHCGKPLPEGF